MISFQVQGLLEEASSDILLLEQEVLDPIKVESHLEAKQESYTGEIS